MIISTMKSRLNRREQSLKKCAIEETARMNSPVKCKVKDLGDIEIICITKEMFHLECIWEEVMRKYHYLGCPKGIGAEIRYLIKSDKGYVAALGFSSAALKCASRDKWIGWDKAMQACNLQKIISNSRFLIFPYVKIPNLASKILSMVTKRIIFDWKRKYGQHIVLLETFVDQRYTGTSYRAANWIKVGQTQGRGKWDTGHKRTKTIKDIYVFPLIPTYYKELGGRIFQPKKLDWAHNEFQQFQAKDKRIRERLCSLAKDFFARPEASIPQACNSRAKTKATYRFFRHDEVTMDSILNSHYQATCDRLSKEKVVLAVQDTTSLNYSGHENPELGFIGDIKENKGISMHDTMVFDIDGVPLGLANLQTWERNPEEHGKKYMRAKRPIEKKESYKWLKSYNALIPIQEKQRKTMIVSVGDREADVFELFQLAQKKENSPKLLVRAHHNRKLDTESGKLWATMEADKSAGELIIDVPRKPGQKKRKATLNITFKEIEIGKQGQKVRMFAVYANEINPLKDVKPVSWMLLTNIEIKTQEDAIEKIKWYTIRWGIEVYHKIIKSGCRVENRQLSTLKSLKACVAVDLVVAWRIFYLTKISRKSPDTSCTSSLEAHEWKALYTYVNKTPDVPDNPPSIREAVRMIASIGGFLGRKCDGEPGPITIWRGLISLSNIAEQYLIFNPVARGQPSYG